MDAQGRPIFLQDNRNKAFVTGEAARIGDNRRTYLLVTTVIVIVIATNVFQLVQENYREYLVGIGGIIIAFLIGSDLLDIFLSKYGKVLDGQLTSIWREEFRGKYAQHVGHIFHPEYAFRTPEGKSLWGTRKVNRPDLGDNMPSGGLPMKILYVNEHLYRVL